MTMIEYTCGRIFISESNYQSVELPLINSSTWKPNFCSNDLMNIALA